MSPKGEGPAAAASVLACLSGVCHLGVSQVSVMPESFCGSF